MRTVNELDQQFVFILNNENKCRIYLYLKLLKYNYVFSIMAMFYNKKAHNQIMR